MKNYLINEFNSLLEKSKNTIIIPHKNPDGDALGSSLALNFFLMKKGLNSVVVSPNDYPSFLNWLPGQNKIINFLSNQKKVISLINDADLILTLDYNDLSRTGEMESLLNSTEIPFVMIDHHENPKSYASITFSEPQISSTSEIVYNIISKLDKNIIDSKIATCLYTGIMTDTGSFRFPSTTSKTHLIASRLIAYGANHSKIHQNVYDNYTFDRIRLLGTCLSNLKKIKNLPVVYTFLSQEDLNLNNFEKGDTEGFVNYGLSLKNIFLSVIMIEDKSQNIIKMSFRSKGNFSVNKFAKTYFNGGGHNNAAGGTSNESLKKTEEKFLKAIKDSKKDFEV
ncbi:MAG: bifunctional oligoribonuclease/PAP phosphatase NrnA [Bacteroidota bacterium]|nr:bifunctional oligoribonuclease/PAP phosphatase NrnA [Bacteroidota bacterium]